MATKATAPKVKTNPPATPPPVFPQSQMKLGALPPVDDPRTLQLSNYFSADNVQIPEAYIWKTNIGDRDWGVMRNDELMDCTIAAAGHLIMAWNADLGRKVESVGDTTKTVMIVAMYSSVIVSCAAVIYFSYKKIKRDKHG
jgi:hypothetical protein